MYHVGPDLLVYTDGDRSGPGQLGPKIQLQTAPKEILSRYDLLLCLLRTNGYDPGGVPRALEFI